MTFPVSVKDEFGREGNVVADSARIEADHFIGACPPAKQFEPDESCPKIPPVRSFEKKTNAAGGVVDTPASLVDPSTFLEPMSCDEPVRRDSDEELIRRILSRDEVALAVVYDRYEGLLHSVATHILQDAGAVEEVLQDTFYQLWRVAASFDSARGTLACWLLVMARNRSIDRVRRRTPVRQPWSGRRLISRVLWQATRWRDGSTRPCEFCRRRSAWSLNSLISKDSRKAKLQNAWGNRWGPSRRG